MLTNWKTISNSIKLLKKLNESLSKENTGFTKKEILKLGTKRDKLERSLGGIAEMKKVPELIFIIDTNIESLAVKEAIKLNIPIIAIVDTNSDPTGIDFPIPGNDDARRAINLYCELVKDTIIDAQKNINEKISEANTKIETDTQTEDKDSKDKTELKKPDTLEQKDKKDDKPKSFFSKVKAFASKKTKTSK
jgi:small subunit ribosomal protein S2